MTASPKKHLSIRRVPEDLARALDSERRRVAKSLNQTVIDLLRSALGLQGGPTPTNGLEKLAGGWSASELRQFEEATTVFERIDEDLWR